MKSKPAKRDTDRSWPFRKITISYLVRDTIKDSVRVAHPSMHEAEIDGLKITVHELIKFACSTVDVLPGVWKSSYKPIWDKVLYYSG